MLIQIASHPADKSHGESAPNELLQLQAALATAEVPGDLTHEHAHTAIRDAVKTKCDGFIDVFVLLLHSH